MDLNQILNRGFGGLRSFLLISLAVGAGNAFAYITWEANGNADTDFADANRAVSTVYDNGATPGDGSAQGNPAVFSWSILPDGTRLASSTSSSTFLTSEMVSTLDAAHDIAEEDQTESLTNRPWFAGIAAGLELISKRSGITYVYEPNDDGANAYLYFGSDGTEASPGVAGVRGDLRIGGVSGQSYGGVSSSSAGSVYHPELWLSVDKYPAVSSLQFLTSHEVMHCLGFSHSTVNGSSSLSSVTGSGGNGRGPQFDDICGLHRKYGDFYEKNGGNDTRTSATDLSTLQINGHVIGAVGPGESILIGDDADDVYVAVDEFDFISIDADDDTDFLKFTVEEDGEVTITLDPRGPTYTNYYTDSTYSVIDIVADELGDLAFNVYDADGVLLQTVNDVGLGKSEVLETHLSAGDYYAEITGDLVYERPVSSASINDLQQYAVQLYAFSVASGETITTPEDTEVGFSVRDSTNANYTVLSGPVNGTLSGTAPDFVYTPDENFFGIDSFTYTVTDDSGTVFQTTLLITVTGVNDLPVANSLKAATLAGTSVELSLTGSDLESDSLAYRVVSSPTNGTLSGVAPDLTYTPNTSQVQTDRFTFVVNDGFADSDPATVTVCALSPATQVLAGYDFDDGTGNATLAPTYTAAYVTSSDYGVGEGLNSVVHTGSSALSERIDAEGNLFGTRTPLSFGGTTSELGYTDTNNGSSFTAPFNNNDYMTFRVTAADGYDLALSRLTFRTYATEQGSPAERWLLFSSVDGFTVGSQIAGGRTLDYATWDGDTNNEIVDLSAAKFQSLTNITFRLYIYGGNNNSTAVTLFDQVILHGTAEFSGNHFPVADAKNETVEEDGAVAITLSGSDTEGSNLTYRVESYPARGTLSGTAPDLTYTPDADYNGSDDFTYIVNDGALDSEAATVSLTVLAANDAPLFSTNLFSVASAVYPAAYSNSLAGAAADVDGDSLAYSLMSGPDWLSISSGGTLGGTPAFSDIGLNCWTVRATDPAGFYAEAALEIEVVDEPVVVFKSGFEYAGGAPTVGTDAAHLNGAEDQIGAWSGSIEEVMSFTDTAGGSLLADGNSQYNASGRPATSAFTFRATLSQSIALDAGSVSFDYGTRRVASSDEKDNQIIGYDSNGSEVFHLVVSANTEVLRLGYDAGAGAVFDLPGTDEDAVDELPKTSAGPNGFITLTLSDAGYTISLDNGSTTYTSSEIAFTGGADLAYLEFTGQGGADDNYRSGFYLDNLTVSGFLDATIDGTPYSWLESHRLVTDGDYDAAGRLDTDGDGRANWQEYCAGTNPTNAASVFKVNSLTSQESGSVLRWSSVSNQMYGVSTSTNLLGGWTSVATNLLATPPENSYTGAPPASASLRFYRIFTEREK
jgi:hypothetical protein